MKCSYLDSSYLFFISHDKTTINNFISYKTYFNENVYHVIKSQLFIPVIEMNDHSCGNVYEGTNMHTNIHIYIHLAD